MEHRHEITTRVIGESPALRVANERLKMGIDKLAEIIRQRTAERDEAVKEYNLAARKFNALTRQYDAIVKKYNALAKKYNSIKIADRAGKYLVKKGEKK